MIRNYIRNEKGNSSLFTVAIFVLCFGTFVLINSAFAKETTDKEYIASLEDNVALSDSTFILGTGQVDQKLYYFVRVIKTEKTLTTSVIKVDASVCDLVEEDIDKPYIYTKERQDILGTEILKQYIVVPKNTIKKEYNSDLK